MDNKQLAGEGLHHAAKAMTFQATVRQLPHHNKETLLVYATARRGNLTDCFGTPYSGGPDMSERNSLLAEQGDSLEGLGASNKGATSDFPGVIGPGGDCAPQVHAIIDMQSLVGVPHPTDVSTISGNAYKKDLQKLLCSRYMGPDRGRPYTPEAKTQKVLRAQDPKTVSGFMVSGTHSSELLPGGSPIIDHAIASLSMQPAWNKTTDTLKQFAKLRITRPKGAP